MARQITTLIRIIADYEGANGSGKIMRDLLVLAERYDKEEMKVEEAAMELQSIYERYIMKMWALIPADADTSALEK